MRYLGLLFAVLLLSSCGSVQNTSEPPILNGAYQLVQLQGEDISSQDLSFTFDLTTDRVSGETSCNGFSANFLQKGAKLSISQAMSTRMFCEGRMEMENKILQAVERAVSVKQEGKDLVFFSTEGARLFTLNKR